MIPLFDRNRRKHFPFINILLITLNIIIYIAAYLSRDSMIVFNFGVIPDRIFIVRDLYRLLTYMFVHGGLLHIIGNMLFLWVFGDNVEDRMGHWKYLQFFIMAGILSVLVQSGISFIAGDSYIPIIGASGAVSAVMGAYLLMFPKARIVTLILVFITVLPSWIFLIIWFLIQFFSALVSGQNTNIAYYAHISGFIFGSLYALFLARGTKIQKISRKRR